MLWVLTASPVQIMSFPRFTIILSPSFTLHKGQTMWYLGMNARPLSVFISVVVLLSHLQLHTKTSLFSTLTGLPYSLRITFSTTL